MPSRIVKGDQVVVTTGREKGKRGEVLKVLPKKERVLIQGVNLIKKHRKPSQASPEGGIVDLEAPLHLSNVMLIDPQDDRPTRVGFEKRDGGWVRIGKRSKAEIPYPAR